MLPPWHPAYDVCGGAGGADLGVVAGKRGEGALLHEIPACPVVAAYGRAYLGASLRCWWGRWRRRGSVRHGHAAELDLATRAVDGHSPSDALREWLRSMGWGADRLTAAGEAHWAAVWPHQQRAATLLPGPVAQNICSVVFWLTLFVTQTTCVASRYLKL